MTKYLEHTISRYVDMFVNGQPAKALIVGFELAWWGKPAADWLYHVRIDEYPFDIQIMQTMLLQGTNIRTNGNTVKVLPFNEKVKAM